MISNSRRAELHGSLFVAAGDDIKMKFYRAALLAQWPGRSMAGIVIAAWLIENMRWGTGEVIKHTSARHLMTLTGLARKQIDDGLAALVAAGLIDRTYIGRGKRGSIWVTKRIIELKSGDCVVDLWPSQVASNEGQESGLDKRPVDNMTGGLHSRPVSGLHSRPQWPSLEASNPIPTIPQTPEASSGSPPVVDQTPTTEGSLTSLPHITSLPANNLNRAPRPPVASATVKTHVAPATTSPRVAEASDTYGYGTEIAGLNGSTSEVVDQIVAMGGGIVLDKTPAWTAVLKAVRQTSPRRVRAAILDLQAKKVAGKLEGRPEHALAAFARRISEEDAAAKLEAAAAKPKFRLIDHMSGGHRR